MLHSRNGLNLNNRELRRACSESGSGRNVLNLFPRDTQCFHCNVNPLDSLCQIIATTDCLFRYILNYYCLVSMFRYYIIPRFHVRWISRLKIRITPSTAISVLQSRDTIQNPLDMSQNILHFS